VTRVDLSVVFVNYRSAALLEAALASWQRDASTLAIGVEWLVVNNGDDAAGLARLASLPVRLLTPGSNLGYAGGANVGLGAARGEALALANPDLLVLPGATAALLGALETCPIAGPRFFWDGGRRLMLPPAETRSPSAELARLLATGDGESAARARRRWRRQARAHWRAVAPLASHDLSGALLVLRRAIWERLGPFDEGYELYFEETDWLARARAAGVGAVYVPAAEVIHLHGQSAAQEAAAGRWFAASASRYRRRWYGEAATARLEQLSGRVAPRRRRPVPESADAALATAAGLETACVPSGDWWVEVSPEPGGVPAAGERLRVPPATPAQLMATWRLPAEVTARVAGPLYARLVDPAGRERASWPLPTAASPASARR
jgi:GT2 family glycosyltransferase